MFRIVVLLSGRGSNFKALYESLLSQSLRPKGSVKFAGVISDNPNAGGVEYARTQGIPVSIVERNAKSKPLSDFFSELTSSVINYAPDLVVLAGFMRILPDELIRHFGGRIINIHPSLLPAFKGLNAQKQALEAGVSESGCTVHFVVPELDSGPIIAQAKVPVLVSDSVETLAARILIEEHKLLPKVVLDIIAKAKAV